MLKKTLFFNNACHLSIRYKQLVIKNKKTGEQNRRPVEDLGFVVLDHQQITFTQAVIQHLAENNTAVIFCDQSHHPASMLFHLDGHQTQTERFRAQIEATKPLKKQLWKQTVKAKIRN
ncbi:MAG TPA: CRISPR-associated endonuclease Cas1, partial [Balneolaceae bacterium]|nr:CRISPR-associated endonuclease Cas1 [Balneolaceae bacterium]